MGLLEEPDALEDSDDITRDLVKWGDREGIR
jgi:hypothetical protein